MIELYDVKKRYGSRCALEVSALSFPIGERCAVLGANGSGKSTLLRILAGTLTPDAGQVKLSAALAGSRGYMPQHPYPFGMSVLQNVAMAALHGDKAAAQQALTAEGLSALAKAKGNELSGGEAQRMAFARMLVRPRDFLLLDEPTSATDIAGNSAVEKALLDYCEATGCTLIFSTHSPAQAQRLAQRVLFLENGRITEDGPAEQVLYRPTGKTAQDFLQFWNLSTQA